MNDNPRIVALDPALSCREDRDEVDEASDDSFPASDPPAYTSAAPRKKAKWTHDSDREGTASAHR